MSSELDPWCQWDNQVETYSRLLDKQIWCLEGDLGDGDLAVRA